ncbi:MAG: WecB/TagA/CpsF family glycosyltransferase [Coleofasciculaceae cyanobacterium]
MPNQLSLPTLKVINSSLTALTFDEQIQTILNWASCKESKTVCVANVHMLMEAYSQSDFARVLEDADLVTSDGMPLVWMMRLMGAFDQQRVAGLDILDSVCQLAQERGVSVFFLGSTAEILEPMRKRLEGEFPKLKIAGMEPLPFRPLTPSEDQAIINEINESGAGLVFVSLGCPKQERWMAQRKGKIKAVMIGLGGAFPVYAGIHKRAPRWVRDKGLEWFYRLLQEPRRLWKRYIETIPPFIWLALKQLLIKAVNEVKFCKKKSRSTKTQLRGNGRAREELLT